jgi:hypothetical protein
VPTSSRYSAVLIFVSQWNKDNILTWQHLTLQYVYVVVIRSNMKYTATLELEAKNALYGVQPIYSRSSLYKALQHFFHTYSSTSRSRWSNGYRPCHWTQGSRVYFQVKVHADMLCWTAVILRTRIFLFSTTSFKLTLGPTWPPDQELWRSFSTRVK